MHKCFRCSELKAPTEFPKAPTVSGLSGVCRECTNKRSREWYAKRVQPSTRKPRKYEDDWECKRCNTVKAYTEFPDDPRTGSGKYGYCKPCKAEYMKEARSKDPDAIFRSNLRTTCKKFGITEEEYYQTLESQGGKCAICDRAPKHSVMTRLVLDHCHISGSFRALLCAKCNSGLGMFEDSPERLMKAAEYLIAFKQSLTS